MAVPKVPKTNDSSTTASASAQTAQEIKSLLQQLRKSARQRKRSGNNVSASDRDDALRLDKLRKIFARLVEQQEFDLTTTGGKGGDDSGVSSQWKDWLGAQHEAFIAYLIEGIVAGRTTALRTFCGVLASSPVDIVGLVKDDKNKAEDGASKKVNRMVSERLLNKLVEAVVKSRQSLDPTTATSSNNNNNSEDEGNALLMSEEPILTLLETEFIRPHRDVQYFVYKGMHQIALDLLGGLDRVTKSANGADNDDAMIAEAERNVGMVAENICRLLMMMEYVPKNQSDLGEDAGFLYPPPVLSGNEDVANDDDDAAEEDDGDDDSSDESDSSSEEEEEEETTLTNKRKKQTPGSSNKRSKKTKLIAWQQTYKHRHAHQEAWLSVLRLPNLPSRTQKRVLQHLSTYVLNVCPSPLRFAEYFTRSFKSGTTIATTGSDTSATNNSNSLTAILSLHGLFILMLNHQLEYPQFYNSLYTLLHPRILYTKHRSRFLRLLSQSLLSNSMLPAYVVAAFCKKLCRLALSGPPSGGLFVLALVSNLLRKHGECACLIHRKGVVMEDVFVEEVDDLVKSRALESSLWELTALEKHYHTAISTLAKSVGTEIDKTTPMHDMEDFMVHTYKSLFEQEKNRLGGQGGGKKKKGGSSRVSLTFVEPEGLFTKEDVFGDFFQCS